MNAADRTALVDRIPSRVRRSRLSPREWECLRADATGRPQKAIAAELGMAYQTFKNHLAEARHKLGVESQAEAFTALGWLRVPSPKEGVLYQAQGDLDELTEAIEGKAREAEAIADGLRVAMAVAAGGEPAG